MRAKYKINNTLLRIGPTNIVETLPQGGEFKPSRGRAVIFPGVYYHLGSINNREQMWVWDCLIENEPDYTFLKGISYNGSLVELSTKFGEHINTWQTYSGQIVDCAFELHEGLIFSGNRRSYRVTLTINCYDDRPIFS